MSEHTITFPDGQTREESFDGAADVARAVVNSLGTNDDGGYRFTLRGKTVTAAQFVAEADARIASYIERRERTHKKITVRYGSSAGCFVKKWVRKESRA